MAVSESFTKDKGSEFGNRGLAPGHSNPPACDKYMQRMVLCGMMGDDDDSMNQWHHKCFA
jgi:hypothetical protein